MFSKSLRYQLTPCPSTHASLGWSHKRVQSQGSPQNLLLHAPPLRALALGPPRKRSLRGPAPRRPAPARPATPPSGGWLGLITPRTHPPGARPSCSSSLAVFNPLTVGLAVRAGICYFASLASLLSLRAPAPPPLAQLAPLFPCLLLRSPRLTRTEGKLRSQPSKREPLRPSDNLTAAGWGRCGRRSFSGESHQRGGPE